MTSLAQPLGRVTPPGIIDRHYRAVKGVTQGSCEEFWNILPDGALPDSKGVDDLVA